MGNKTEQAVALFSQGYNCAQAVLLPFAEMLGTGRETPENLSAGFGGGMSRMQKTCGAVTGAVMVLGGIYSGRYPKGQDYSEELRDAVQKLFSDFEKEFGHTDCYPLLGANLNTEEGRRLVEEKDMGGQRCSRFVAFAAGQLEKLAGGTP